MGTDPNFIEGLSPFLIVGTVRVSRSCMRDEGSPLGIGLHEQVPNSLELLCSKGMVVNVK